MRISKLKLEDFYSQVSRLLKLIEVAIEKKQRKNAEEYLKYFFHTAVRYYEKEIEPTNEKNNEFPLYQDENDSDKIGNRFLARSAERRIIPFGNDFFLNAILELTKRNIEDGDYETYRLTSTLMKDSIKVMLDSSKYSKYALPMLGIYKFTSDIILSSTSIKSKYYEGWVEDSTYEWFIDLYVAVGSSLDAISMLDTEFMYVLKYYVDHDFHELFRRFLLSLSHRIFSFRNRSLEDIADIVILKEGVDKFDFRLSLGDLRNKCTQLFTIPVFTQTIPAAIESLIDSFVALPVASSERNQLFERIYERCTYIFKDEYPKIITAKAVIYSLFRRRKQFLLDYLTYHQPPDSDASWSNDNYGLRSPHEMLRLIDLKDSILSDWALFHVDHHGFQIYFDTFVGLFLGTNKERSKSAINGITAYSEASTIAFELENIKHNFNYELVDHVIQKVPQSEIVANLAELHIVATSRSEQLLDADIKVAEIKQEYIESFKSGFVSAFYNRAEIRDFLTRFTGKPIQENRADGKGFGINQLVPKEMFIEQSRVTYVNIPDSFAENVARTENIILLGEIQQNCKVVKYRRDNRELELRKLIGNYDILIIGDSEAYFHGLKFISKWNVQSSLSDLSVFSGVLENSINVASINWPISGMIALNSSRLCRLVQLKAKDFDTATDLDIFKFSFQEFKENEEPFERLKGEKNMSPSELLKSVWIQIYERVELKFDENFDGIILEAE